MTTPTARHPHPPIAVIGVSGRYPGGADSIALLWRKLVDGVDCVSEARGDRWDLGWHHPDPKHSGRVYTRAGGFLGNIDSFDAEFFGLSPREARQVDPQQRLLLELAWEALEDAGIPAQSLAGSDTGVFVGISSNDYANLVGPGSPDAYSNTGSSFAIAANRISYFLDLHGPSLALDTACSSGLVAIHQACTNLAEGACSMALVGAVSIIAHIRPWLGFAAASMLSPDGRCKSFDASGNGYVRSEGGGIVVLKTLADAERDGDTILGVILASGVNSDGHTLGLSMPNVEAQAQLLQTVYRNAGVHAEQVRYVEAHGTGTAVGDPIECESIGRVLGMPRSDGSRCLIGSVKSNIGHLEPAAGIAGLTKALLVLKHRTIPANLHFRTPNPKIDFDAWKLQVVDTQRPLPAGAEPTVIGVNSFGFGGTNAHVVLQEYRPAVGVPDCRAPATLSAAAQPEVLLLSAQTPAALLEVAARHATFLAGQTEASWPDICASAALGRSRLRQRLALAARSATEAAGQLEAFVAGGKPSRLATGTAPGAGAARLALVFSGNGPQWWGMGRELLAAEPAFRAAIAEVDAIFAPLSGWSLLAEMERPEPESRMALTEYAQPMLFAQQVALTALLRAAGIEPVATIGHSVGEVAAAQVSGALTLEQATRVIYFRSLYQSRTQGMGKMAAVGLGAEELARTVQSTPGWLEIAAWNSPRAATIAGDPVALGQLEATLTAAGKFVRVLALDYPFHTRAMDPIREPLLAALADLRPGAGHLPFVSTVEGATLAGEALGADYWWRNVREPVHFQQGIDHLLDQGVDVFLEVGPHPVLRDYVQQAIKARNGTAQALGSLRRPSAGHADTDVDHLWNAICACHTAGAIAASPRYRRPAEWAALPSYPWQRVRHWRGAINLPGTYYPLERDHPLLGFRVPSADGIWENPVDTQLLPFLNDHVVQDAVVFPAAGHIENLFNACRRQLGEGTATIEDFEILRPLTLAPGQEPQLQTAVGSADGCFEVRVHQDAYASEWTTLVRGRCSRGVAPGEQEVIGLAALAERLPVALDAAAHYRCCVRRGMRYGAQFQGMIGARLSAPDAVHREALGEIHLPQLDEAALGPWLAHPALVDACIQLLISLIAQNEPRECSIIPVQIERTTLIDRLPGHLFCHVRLVRESARSAVADFDLTDAGGAVRMTIRGARCSKVDFQQGGPGGMIAEGWRPDPGWADLQACDLGLPAPSTLVADLPASVGSAYDDARAPLEALVAAYAGSTLEQLGARTGSFDLPRLIRRGRVNPEHADLLERLVMLAQAAGQLSGDEGSWHWNADQVMPSPFALWRELLLAHPALVGELQLIADRGDRLVQLLRADAEETLGPGGLAPADGLYDHSLFQAPAAAAVKALLTRLVSRWPESAPLRVLEVGAGRGGFTMNVLPLLPATRTDYLFSDRSEALLETAAHRFGSHAAIRFARYDLDLDPASQGLRGGAFDLILAGNALHHSGDLPVTLAHLRTLLAPGGMLLVQSARPDAVQDLLFGLDPAWWSGADFPQRGGHRLPDDAAWPGLLRSCGLSDPMRVADTAATAQAVWLAQAPLSSAFGLPPPAPGERVRRLLLVDPDAVGTPLLDGLCHALGAEGQPPRIEVIARDATLDGAAVSGLLGQGSFDELVFMLDADSAALTAGSLASHQRQGMSLLHLVQTIARSESAPTPRLTVVTRAALPTASASGPPDPAQAPLWGLARVISNEHPSLECRLIDLHAGTDRRAAGGWLARALLARDGETEVQLHQGRRYLARARLTSLVDEARQAGRDGTVEACRLDFLPQGGLDSLHLRALDRRAPGAGEVEVRVRAAGLNFRDVLWVMGMLPEEALEHGFSGPTIGMECAGEVVRVGAGVETPRPGDRVIGFASACFASHVTTSAASLAALPDGIDFAAAASIPTTFLTAWYALDHLARLEPGEVVLVHGAAGGVGLAAVQIALLKGATVIGTAGSPAKRRLLAKLGVAHVLDSRSLAFADEVMALTGGVDVVLNSLAGEAITKGLQILRPFGRFLEIGKRDLYANSRIGLRPFRQNVSYFGIDADTLLVERPALARRTLDQVMSLFRQGALRPIPFQTVPIERAGEAFRAMQQSRHVGKLVVTLPERLDTLPVVPGPRPLPGTGTWLVTGGLGGFGLATARWLAAQGVRSLALLGRRGAATEEARAGIAAIEAAGAQVRAFATDVADGAALAATIATIRSEMGPLRGVYHAAASIEDAPVLGIGAELLQRVLAPKVLGAWNLHQATLEDRLEQFVLYSSSSVLVGNPGQACYVAGNLYLEALAELRRSQGRPALAVGWGAIKDAGFLTRHENVAEMLRNRSGLAAMPVADALAELARLDAVGARRVTVAQFNLKRLGQMLPGMRVPRFVNIIPAGMADLGEHADGLGTLLRSAPEAERLPLAIARLTQHVARILATGATQIDAERPLPDLGLDSLMAVELAEAVEQDLGLPISVMQLLGAGNLRAIAELVLRAVAASAASNGSEAIAEAAPSQPSTATSHA